MDVAFTYSFPHKKSQDGLFRLIASNNKPKLVIAAPWRKLPYGKQLIRTSLLGHNYLTSRDICKSFGIEYLEAEHNGFETSNKLEALKPKHGIILGARILKPEIIDLFEVGILNLHPGLLPENRGLDTIKWAVLENLRQGVTAHVIDSNIDRGHIISITETPVYESDNFLELTLRVQDTEMHLLAESVEKFKTGSWQNSSIAAQGKYHNSMNQMEEQEAALKLEKYLAQFSNPEN